jgi:hypothetical protein
MQILVTDKGNLLVDNDGIYGFFDKVGNFIRLSDGKEWNWSAKRMQVFVGKAPDFDLKSLSEAKPVTDEEFFIQIKNRAFTFADLIKSGTQKKKNKVSVTNTF